jgi:hypothetical protein
MDILSNFEIYLKEYCEKNHIKVPRDKDKIWKVVWDSYVKEKLVLNWENYKNEYLNMELLTKSKQQKLQAQEVEEEEVEESDWDKVSKLLN